MINSEAQIHKFTSTACPNQLLIAIRSFTPFCDHSRSKTRLTAIMNLIAKLGIIYAIAWHASLCTSTVDCLSVSCHWRRTVLTTIIIQTRHGEGEVGISESAAAAAGTLGLCKLLCWLPLTASRNTHFLLSCATQSHTELRSLLQPPLPPPATVTDRPTATVHPHWCHIASTVAHLGSLAYCTTIRGALDRDQLLTTSRSSIILLSDRGKPY